MIDRFSMAHPLSHDVAARFAEGEAMIREYGEAWPRPSRVFNPSRDASHVSSPAPMPATFAKIDQLREAMRLELPKVAPLHLSMPQRRANDHAHNTTALRKFSEQLTAFKAAGCSSASIRIAEEGVARCIKALARTEAYMDDAEIAAARARPAVLASTAIAAASGPQPAPAVTAAVPATTVSAQAIPAAKDDLAARARAALAASVARVNKANGFTDVSTPTADARPVKTPDTASVSTDGRTLAQRCVDRINQAHGFDR